MLRQSTTSQVVKSHQIAISWKKAVGLGFLAVYVPFVAMTLYTLAFVSCSHCKKAALMTLPIGPGLVPGFFTLHGLHVPESPRVWAILVFVAYSLLAVLILAGLMRLAGRWWPAILVLGLAGYGVLAVLTLMMIRA